MQTINPLNSQNIRSNPIDFCTHCHEKVTEILDVRFRSSITNYAFSTSQTCGHNNIFGSHHAHFVKENFCSMQSFRCGKNITIAKHLNVRSQTSKCVNMSIQRPTTNLIAARSRDFGMTETRQQRCCQ